MKLHSKWNNTLLAIIGILLNGCITNENSSSENFITDGQKTLIRTFAIENGYPSTMALDSFIRYEYYDWPYDADIKDFFLTFPKQDATPRTLVLSDVLTKIGKGLRVHYEPAPYGGTIYQAYIDSIEVRTDSVIVLPGLNLSDCGLTHLPPEIGKMRVKSLDITYNNLTTLPLEIMQLLDPPKYFSYTIMDWSGSKDFKFDSLPDTLKNWFENVYSKQNFED
jgi:hypothetical protein